MFIILHICNNGIEYYFIVHENSCFKLQYKPEYVLFINHENLYLNIHKHTLLSYIEVKTQSSIINIKPGTYMFLDPICHVASIY